MDKAVRSEYSSKFFSNTNVIKSHDDFCPKDKQNTLNYEKSGEISKTGISQDDTLASESVIFSHQNLKVLHAIGDCEEISSFSSNNDDDDAQEDLLS